MRDRRRPKSGKRNIVTCAAVGLCLLLLYTVLVLDLGWEEEELQDAGQVGIETMSQGEFEYWMKLEEKAELAEELEEELEERVMEREEEERRQRMKEREEHKSTEEDQGRRMNVEEYTRAEEEEEEEREVEALLRLEEAMAREAREEREKRREEGERHREEEGDERALWQKFEAEDSLSYVAETPGEEEYGWGVVEDDEEAEEGYEENWEEVLERWQEEEEELELVQEKGESGPLSGIGGVVQEDSNGEEDEGMSRVMQLLPFPPDPPVRPNFLRITDHEQAWPFAMPTAVVPPMCETRAVRKTELAHTELSRMTPIHRMWQIAVPNTASTTFEKAIRQGIGLDLSERVCEGSDVVLLSESCPVDVWKFLSEIKSEPSSGGHADWSRWDVDLEGLAHGAYGLMMMRDPGNYMWKMFYDGMGHPKFDSRFLPEFGLEDKEEVTFAQYIDMVYYKWNFWTRTLSSDFYPRHSTLDYSGDDITRERALQLRKEGVHSRLFQTAYTNLEKLNFVGMYHRLEETMELLYYTFCWNFEHYPFTFRPRDHSRFPDVTLEEQLLLEEAHALDYILFRRAEELFDQRIAQMRSEKEQGFTCNLLLRGCAVACP